MDRIIIRDIQLEDNLEIETIIKNVLEDFKVPKTKSSYADPSLKNMYKAYNKNDAHFYIAEINGVIIGGAGIAQLDHYDGSVCELQKMYLSPNARGKGIGTLLIDTCLKKAKELEYTQCYLETLPGMKTAQKMYLKYEFRYLDAAMGNTGHSVCPVWMLKDL